MDYCNGIFGSTSALHLRLLQSVVNAIARLIVKRRKYDHITDSLRGDLHWLPIHYRCYYKLCIFIYKCLHCAAPSYLVDQCIPIAMNSARSGLRSATNRNLAYPRTNLVRYSNGASASLVQRPEMNYQRIYVTQTSVWMHFAKKLKTVLFSRSYYS